MAYTIPDDDEIVDALRAVMRRMKAVGSLRKLREFVIKELRFKDRDYTVGHERLREIAVTAPFVNTHIEARHVEERKDLKGRCPVCSGKLDKTKNETIFGGTVTIGYECDSCPYWTTLKMRVPIRYRFEYYKEHS